VKFVSSVSAELDRLCDLALAMFELGRLDEARDCYEKVLIQNPSHFVALHMLGTLHGQAGNLALSLSLLDRAIAVNPGVAETHHNRGLVLSELKRPWDALASFDQATGLNPDYAVAHNSHGIALFALGRVEDALASFRRAAALQPAYAEADCNLGMALHELCRLEEAVAAYDRAIAASPGNAAAHNDRGSVLLELNRVDEAIASYGRAIALQPDYPDAWRNRSLALLLSGRLEEGWRQYEWRKRGSDVRQLAFGRGRVWSGEDDLAGKRVFLHSEQGFGDTIQFCRYVRVLADRGADVVLSVQEPLAPLLQQLTPDQPVLSEEQYPPHFDYYSSLLSLPLAVGTTLDTIPAWPSYLRADETRRDHFEALLGPKVAPRIGIAWSGSSTLKNDHNRSIAFERLAPLIVDDVQWVCLQNEIRPADAAALRGAGRVGFFGEALRDFSDTAALLDLMDMVVTVDTSIAHLAGAMGKPVWILLPFNPAWRWLLHRPDSPWYPSARLFRQPRIGDWESVIGEVIAELPSAIG
jgi:Flp pilus assembly protein TadD